MDAQLLKELLLNAYKAEEDDEPLDVEPPNSVFLSTGGSSFHTIVSLSKCRLAFKMRSSNNEHYKVRPVFGFIDPNGTTTLKIKRRRGPAKKDTLAIQWAKVSDEETDPKAPFKAQVPGGQVFIPLVAE